MAFATLRARGLKIKALKSTETVGGNFDVYLKNNCSKEMRLPFAQMAILQFLNTNKTGDKQKVAVKARYEVYIDGKLFQN